MAWTTPRTWVTDELVTATIMNTHVRDNLSYLKGRTDESDANKQSITRLTAFSTNLASIDVSNPASGFSDLCIHVRTTTDSVAMSDGVQLEFNNDSTASNYYDQLLMAFGSTVLASENLGVNGFIRFISTGGGAASGLFGEAFIRIFNYASTSQEKAVQITTGLAEGTSTGKIYAGLYRGIYRSTSAITQVSLTPQNGSNFTSGAYAVWLEG